MKQEYDIVNNQGLQLPDEHHYDTHYILFLPPKKPEMDDTACSLLQYAALSGQFGLVVVKRINLFIELPSLCAMTGFAADLKISAMRRFGLLIEKIREQT